MAMYYKLGDKSHITNQLFIVFLNLIFFLGACNNDVNINEEWEDKTIVYCVLNQKDTAHYVRIQHAFYSVGNNYSSTSEPDSIYYNEELDVKLERWKDDQLVEILILEKTNDILKDSGYFTTENHVLYKTKNTLYPDSKYELKIFIPSLKKSVSASTYLIKDFTLNEETIRYFSKPINFSLNSTFPYGWITSEYGKQFQPVILFNYTKTTYTSYEDKLISWYLPKTLALYTSGNEQVQLNILKSEFLKFVGITLSEIAFNDFRRPENIELKIEVVTDELYTYRQLNSVGIRLSQEIPIFTNVENGYGIFTARNYITFNGYTLDGRTWDSLACGQYTQHLNFVNRWGNIHNCD